MAHLKSDSASFRCDNESASLTDYSSSINSVTINGGNASVDDTGMGDSRHTEINDVGPIMTMTINGMINSTTRALVDPLLDGTSLAKTVEYSSDGSNYITGEARVGTVSVSAPIGLLTFSVEFRSADTTGFTNTSVAAS